MTKRKDGRWLKVVIDGAKRLYFYSSKKTEKQAEKDIEKQILAYREKELKGKTFREVAEEWYDKHIPTVEVQTAEAYKPSYKYSIEVFGEIYIKELTPQNIQNAIDRKAVKGYAMKTMRNQLSIFSSIFKYAFVMGYISSNPCEYIKLPKNLKRGRRNIPNAEQIEKVKVSTNSQMGLLAYLLLYTGLRKGEALALTYEDIDYKNNRIFVTKSVYHDGNIPHVKQPKTEAGEREVYLFSCLADKLHAAGKTGLIFPGHDGELMHKSSFAKRWKKYQNENGITITPHQLRHAYASYILFDAGVDVKAAQSLLGHADISVTQNIYTHITEAHRQSTYNILNSFVEQFNNAN